MRLLAKLTNKYNQRDLYDHRKAEYSIGFVIILAFITVFLTVFKAILVGVTDLEIIISIANLIVFAIIFSLIYAGKLSIGIWILNVAGIVRILNVYILYDLLHFYTILPLILIASSFIHFKKTQYHFVNVSIFTISIYNMFIVFLSYSNNEVVFEEAIIAIVSFLYLVAIMYIIEVFTRNTDKEIKMTEDLKEMANKDYLTQVFNRRKLDSVKEFDFVDAVNSILIIDFDHFKEVNDKYGHLVGDEVLKETLSVIGNLIRKDDFIVRFGGEEFIIVLRDCNHKNAQLVAEKIRSEVSKHYYECIEGTQITISIGGTTMKHEEGIYNTIERADKAMYKAKSSGRNQVVFEQ